MTPAQQLSLCIISYSANLDNSEGENVAPATFFYNYLTPAPDVIGSYVRPHCHWRSRPRDDDDSDHISDHTGGGVSPVSPSLRDSGTSLTEPGSASLLRASPRSPASCSR